MLMDASRSHLVVVDVQARLMPAIHEGESLVRNLAILLEAAKRLRVPVTVTEQYPKGLGATLAVSGGGAPPRRGHPVEDHLLGRPGAFDCGADCNPARQRPGSARDLRGRGAYLRAADRPGVQDVRLEVFVVADAVSSRSPHSVSAACARLLHAGCHWVTTEMVAFEWMERAATDDFRALAPLFKD